MASIRKREGPRGVSWIVDYVTPDGKRIRKSFKMKKQATAYKAKVEVSINEGDYSDPRKYSKVTLGQLIEKYERNLSYQKSFATSKKYQLETISDYFSKDCLLINIQFEQLETFRNELKQRPTKHDTERKAATVNRTMACLRHLFTKAGEWDLVKRNPFEGKSKLHLEENNERIRYLTNKRFDPEIEGKDEYERLFSECPGYLKDIVDCAVLSAMRKSEILNLKWSQIINGWIYLKDTKSKKPEKVPICDDLDTLFRKIRKEKQLISEYVFTYQGKPIADIKTAFNNAKRKAGIENFRFHDLRHTAISWYVMAGGSIKGAQELARHKNIKTTMRYLHLAPAFQKNEVNLLNGLTSNSAMSQNVSNCHFSPNSRLADNT